MRIALLSYRSKTHCGGQGVYVRKLSHGLAELGHEVEVFSGQPYPELLDPRVKLTEVPSLDLYRDSDPFRTPRPGEIRDRIDLLELGTMWTAGFPEPRTFSLRAARLLRSRAADFAPRSERAGRNARRWPSEATCTGPGRRAPRPRGGDGAASG